ncbi:hypothetical protein [Reinekea sp. G2M2-21]|uniref:hypothetical protein n=1 Tax=Reinekea sp. G2M2-21 TaxID=2788942 RepID=UPI0018ABDBCC|nr:hypothetical protein [Reinekea sp. G2M2-21]
MNLTPEQKSNYINALGIEPWYPRMVLINAKPAQALVLDTIERGETSLSEVPESTLQAVSVLEETRNIEQQEQPEALLADSATQNSEKPIRFGLALYVIDDWIVCSSLISDYQQYNDVAGKLIHSILKSISDGTGTLHYHHVISWPFFSNRQVSQGIEPARQYVNGVIEHLVEQHKASKLLVCGGVLAKLNQWHEVEGEEFGLSRVNIPSVYKMLNDPQQKVKAWHLIQKSSLFKNDS